MTAIVREKKTGDVQAWLRSVGVDPLVVSDWVVAEFSSALALKLRTGTIELEHRALALATLARMVPSQLAVLQVASADFRAAASYADRHTLGLRASDALHLAIAARQGALLCTLDRRLAEAGRALGVRTELL